MSLKFWQNLYWALGLSLIIAGSTIAQQHQHQPPGGASAPPDPPPAVSPGGAEQSPMRHRMQGMMEHRQRMMGQGTAPAAEAHDDDDDSLPRRGGMRGHHGMLARVTRQLDLNEEQRAQVRTLWHTQRKQAIRLEAEIAIAAIDLHELLETEPVNLPKTKELVQAMATRRAELHYAQIVLMQDIRKLLTPEQHKKFRTLLGKMAMHGLGGHGSRHESGGHGQSWGER